MSNTINKDAEIYKELKKEFPQKAYSEDTSRGFALTSLRAQYVADRLNDVFGIFGWLFEGEAVDNDKGHLIKGILTVTIGDKSRVVTQYGFSTIKKNLGDTYKSAMTDALGKCASMIGVGDEVFKGHIQLSESPTDNNYKKNTSNAPKPNSSDPFRFVNGKNKGKLVSECDDGFLNWVVSKFDNQAVKKLAIDELAKRQNATPDASAIGADKIPF